MNRTEFKQWGDDLNVVHPEVYAYIASQPKETRDSWFTEIFEPHELEDAIQMNRNFLRDGWGLHYYQRSQLPAVFVQRLREARFARLERERPKDRDYIGDGSGMTADVSIVEEYHRALAAKAGGATS